MATNHKHTTPFVECPVFRVQSYFRVVRSTKMKLHGTRAYIDPTPVPKMPPGLVELMEGLSREVLKNNPSEVYEFCAQHMKSLLVLRDGKPPEKYLTLEQKIVKANKIIKERAEERRRNFDHEKQDIKEQLFDNDINIACNVIETDNLIKPKEDSDLREENETISDYDIKSEDNNVDIGMNVKENEGTAESLNEKDICDKGISANNQVNYDAILKNPVSDAKKNDIDSPHSIEHGKDIGENEGECLELLGQIDIAEKENDIKQAVTEKRIDNPNAPNVGEIDYKIVQNIDITPKNTINSNVVSNNNEIDDVPNAEICKVSTEDITVKNETDIAQDISKTGAEQNNIFDTNSTSEFNNSTSNIEIDNDENKDNNLQKKLIGIGVENISKDNEKNDTKNVIKTDVMNTNPEIEVNAIISEQNDDMNKETVEGSSHISQNQTNNTETDKEDNKINNLNHKKENEIKAKICVEDAVTESENKKHDLKATNEPQSKIIDKMLESDPVILISEQHIQGTNDTNVTAKNNDNTNESSDMNNVITDPKNSETLLVTVRSEQHDQDNKNDENSNQYNSQHITKESDESVSKNIEPEKNVKEKEDEQNNDQQDISKKGGDQNIILNTHGKNQLNYNNSGHNIEDQENKDTAELKSPRTMDLETAAITIQKVFRNFLFRSKTSSFEEPTNIEFNIIEREADNKIENDLNIHKQNKDRRVMGISRMDTVLQTVNEEKSLSLSTDDSSTISSAATVIQAHIRGFLCRNRLNRNKARSSASLNASHDSSPVSSETDPDLVKNKTFLNIHIVPENSQCISMDESLLTSMELSLDGSPPTSANLHPLGYDKSERRKQLKREDAIQSISPPSNNSRLSEEQDSVKEVLINEVEIEKTDKIDPEMSVDSEIKIAISNDGIISKNGLKEKQPSNENLKDSIRLSEEQEHIKEVLIRNDKIEVEHNFDIMVAADSQVTIDISNDDREKKGLEEKYSPGQNSKDNRRNQELEYVKDALINEDKIEIEKNISIVIAADSQKNIPVSNDVSIPKISGENLNDENSLHEEQESVMKVHEEKEATQQMIESEKTIDSELNIATSHNNVPKSIGEENQLTEKNLKSSDDVKCGTVTEISSDELDVVTPFTPTEEKLNDSDKPKLLHSGEFHDVVLPTKVSRNDTSIVSDFHNVLVYFLVWNN